MHDRQISWWRTQFGDAEIERMADGIRHERISQGALTAEFEQRLSHVLGVPHVVATTSGSMALYMALLAVGVGQGDEVLVPNRTWIAGAHAALLCGAKVRLVDDEPDRPVMDLEDARRKITSRTKVIMPVHLNGRAVDMDKVQALARDHGLRVVEDAAQALMSRNRHGFLGAQSDIGCFSLSLAKIISTGQGGFTVTRDERLYRRLVSMRTHGVTDVINPVWTEPGFNFRYNDILAAMGLVQLSRLEDRVACVKALYQRYRSGLAGLKCVELVPLDLAGGELPIYVEVYSRFRTAIIQHLAGCQIQARPFYPTLNQAAYLASQDAMPHSEKSCAGTFFLPCGPDQPLANVDSVLAALRDFERSQPTA